MTFLKLLFLKLLLSSGIICIAIMAKANPMDDEESIIPEIEIDEESNVVHSVLNNKPSSISDDVLPIHYNMQLILFNNYLINECTITLNISYVKRYISFYVPNSSDITALTLTQNNGTTYEIKSTNYDENNIIVLDFGDVLLHGTYNLNIEFIIPINIVRESFGTPYINKDGKKEWLIATGIQTKEQQIFPYWGKPKLRITFVISILHHPKYTALSNMQIRKTRILTYDNMMWTDFHETASISIDSVAFLVSDFNRINILVEEAINQTLWCKQQSKLHLEFAETVILYASVYMRNCTWNILRKALEQTSVPFESKVDHVVIPDLQDEIKQTFGFIFYREADIIYNKELDPVAYKTIIARLIARGMVQKYIRNLLEPTYWYHTWLNEGFNVFLQAYIIDKALPYSRMMDLFVVQVQHELLYLNNYLIINSTIKYNSYYENYLHSSLSHIKGSIIWRMLERTLSSDVFLMGIDRYLNNQLDDPEATTSRNLWSAMRSVMIELNSKYEFNIKSMVDSLIMQKYPSVLEVTRNYSTNIVNVSVQFYNKLENMNEEQYYIPVTYTTESTPNFTITWSNIWLTPWSSTIEFSLEENQWIIFNLQQAGYYRVNYDTENWRKIAQYLNSKDYSNIHVLNRAQIINDAFHFAIEKKLEFSVFWELASYLAQEKDYIAWYPMFKAFEFLSNIFPHLDFYPEFKEVLRFDFMRNFKKGYWNLYDESSTNDHMKCLKQELAKWECIISDDPCEEKSRVHLKWHLANPKENRLLPGWKRWTYCNGLKTADSDTWNTIFNDYMKDDTILECLAYSKNSEIIINYLEVKLSQILLKPRYNRSHLQLEPIEQAYALNAKIFLSVIERHTKYMLTSLLNNYKVIKHRRVNEIATLIVIINNAYSEEQLHKIMKFVTEELESSTNVKDNVKGKIVKRWWEIQRQTKYFRSLFNN
ncbi:Aminopeptidase N [Camponotus japonicus]